MTVGPGTQHIFSQEAFRVRDDTADSNEDAGWLAPINTNWAQETDTPFRVRWNIEKTAVIGGSINVYMDLYYSLNGGTWTYVDNADEFYTTDSILHCIESSNEAGYIHSTDTTYLLGSDVALKTPNSGIVESLGWSSPNINWGSGEGIRSADYEFCLTLRSSLVSPGDRIGLRVYYNDISLDVKGSYNEDATMIVPGEVPGTDALLRIKGDALQLKGSSLIIK
jgi:hypothetical protein